MACPGRLTEILPCLTPKNATRLRGPAPEKAGHPHKVLHLTSYERLEAVSAARSPRGISTC